MITISMCMIVKNEEQVLKRCLDSVKGLVDEMIIVDTGSTDKTIEIAKQYTDKIYEYEWIDDFADARNFSFSKANMDYIYVADADEVIDDENKKKFLLLKEAMLPEVEIVQMIYCNQLLHNTTYNFDEEYRPKLFKRVRSFQWIEPIHETVNLEPVVFDSDIKIMHLPLENHGKRDFSFFQKLIAKDQRLSKKLHNMYARELYIVEDEASFIEAIPFFAASAMDSERSQEEIKEALCVLAKGYRLTKDISGLFKSCVKGVADEGSSEICYEIGSYFMEQKDYEEAALWFYNAAFETEAILNLKYQKEYPFKMLVKCYQKCGRYAEAEEYEKLLGES